MSRQKTAAQQPWKPPARRPPKPKGPTAPGTLGNPYERSDGAATVKIAFRATLECVSQLEQLVARLKMEGFSRNEWLEELILHGIRTGFRPEREADLQEAG
jgi:hypothetical protein